MGELTGNIVVLVSVLTLIPIIFSKRLRHSLLWRATVTPLASIIGSGFLIAAPLVILTTGKGAPLTIFIIIVIAYHLGSAMRFNILFLEPLLNSKTPSSFVSRLEAVSRPLLGISYMISVAFYLKLLSIFTLQGFTLDDPILENMLTTAILLFIAITGWFKGLNTLEIFEKYAVNSKLIIIGAMIIGYLYYNGALALEGNWILGEHNHDTPFEVFKKLLGILLIVQGFETSRYIGNLYPADVRVKTMRYAQVISGIIYIVFISLAMVLFNEIHTVGEAVVIDLCRLVAPILPVLLIFAAVMSQFSAAIADAIGSSGLIAEASHRFISTKQGTLLTVGVAIFLIWFTNIYELITIASKAFAIYYGIQCLIAARLSYLKNYKLKTIGFVILVLLMILVISLGVPVEEVNH